MKNVKVKSYLRGNIIEQAKNTVYKHPRWFIGGQKNVYDVMKYYADSNDFYIDLKPSFAYKDELIKIGYNGEFNRAPIIDWLIKNKHYDKLRIRFSGHEGGSDSGSLKIKTYLLLHDNLSRR